MRKIALIALISLPLLADFFPQTVQTSIKQVASKSVTLASAFPVNGMSGVVIHGYGSGLTAITSSVRQTSSNGEASILADGILHHEQLPTINTAIAAGDKVIGGYLYNNVLLLAPDADTYAKITSSEQKTWIHPDLFALFLSTEGESQPTKENLATFAKAYQVGLVYIVRQNSAVLLDPISGQIVSKKAMANLPVKGKFPFYMRFDELKSGWFNKKTEGSYYKTMETL